MKRRQERSVFVSDPQAPGDNDLAERSLRPAVVARKISGGRPLGERLPDQAGPDEPGRYLASPGQTAAGQLQATALP